MSGGDIALGKGRFEAFSDGVFAIAITLLVLGFQPPDLHRVTDDAITQGLLALWPQYLVYVASFATVGIMWLNHHALFARLKAVPHGVMLVNLALLMVVSFLPFPTSVLGRYGLMRSPVVYYGLTLIAASICFGALQYLVNLRSEERASFIDFLKRRNIWNTMGIIAYAAGIPLAYYSPLATIVLYAAVALYYTLPTGIRAAANAQSLHL
ncbi:MAG TPA: TMEM175 family protein [Candidatus Eremiobacteraceae bacterium]|nr:TMEM175 family protein [Candidatus Eremiobacteraceae bacterium]